MEMLVHTTIYRFGSLPMNLALVHRFVTQDYSKNNSKIGFESVSLETSMQEYWMSRDTAGHPARGRALCTQKSRSCCARDDISSQLPAPLGVIPVLQVTSRPRRDRSSIAASEKSLRN